MNARSKRRAQTQRGSPALHCLQQLSRVALRDLGYVACYLYLKVNVAASGALTGAGWNLSGKLVARSLPATVLNETLSVLCRAWLCVSLSNLLESNDVYELRVEWLNEQA